MSLINNVSPETREAIETQAPRLLTDAAERYLPAHLRTALNQMVDAYESGSALDAAQQVGLRALINSGQFLAVRELFLNTENPLMGGLTPLQAVDLISRSPRRAQANLFVVSVTPIDSSAENVSDSFNMLCTNAEYSPFTVSGEYQNVGGAKVSTIAGNEAVELTLTTNDDMSGTLKRWFAQMSARAAAGDGTVGVPASYGIRIAITHAFAGGDIPDAAYTDEGVYRTANLALSTRRGENALAELNMTFSQLDTFWG